MNERSRKTLLTHKRCNVRVEKNRIRPLFPKEERNKPFRGHGYYKNMHWVRGTQGDLFFFTCCVDGVKNTTVFYFLSENKYCLSFIPQAIYRIGPSRSECPVIHRQQINVYAM